jgi:hypothetical protein
LIIPQKTKMKIQFILNLIMRNTLSLVPDKIQLETPA